MNKKNTGATIGVLVAVSIGATAYASAINNLEKDTYTKNLLENKVSYVEPTYEAKLNRVKANYTKDLENTKIGESEKELNIATKQENATLYKALNNVSDDEIETKSNDNSDAETNQDINEEKNEEVKENAYNETIKIEKDLEATTFESENNVEVGNNESLDQIETKDDESVYVEKFVNVESLNVRKLANINSDVITSIIAGSKISGYIHGEWLNTELGYVKLEYLDNTYPEELVNSIERRKAEEERKVKEEAQRKAEEERRAKEEAQRRAEEERRAKEEAEKNKPVNYTGWVNTAGLNIRSNATTNGNILGNLTKGDKITGTLQNGWIKFNYNGSQGFVNASFVVDYAVEKPAPASEPVIAQNKQENNQQAQPVKQANGSGQAAANIAQQFSGYPYVFGANDPSIGFDCSGLVYYAYKQLGITLSRNSAAQFSNGYSVDSSNLIPGDLVFFSSGGMIDHVGMITGYDGTFIHASSPGVGVVYGNIYSSYYQSSFRGARRIY